MWSDFISGSSDGMLSIGIYEVIEAEPVKEINTEIRSGCEENNVNTAFIELLDKLWGKDFNAHIKEHLRQDWETIQQNFEKLKSHMRTDETKKYPLLRIPLSFVKAYRRIKSGDIWENVNNKYLGIEIDADYCLLIHQDAILRLYKYTTRQTISLLREQFKYAERYNVKYLFMFGELSTSVVFTAAVKKEFEKKMTVLIPDDSLSTVTKGAVMCSKYPGFFEKRCYFSHTIDKKMNTLRPF